jgi:hypothetical protein
MAEYDRPVGPPQEQSSFEENLAYTDLWRGFPPIPITDKGKTTHIPALLYAMRGVVEIGKYLTKH